MSKLSPITALAEAIKASQMLLKRLESFEEQEAEQIEKTEKLVQIRQQFIEKTFAEPWQEDAVQEHQTQFQQLEQLDAKLRELATDTRLSLHKQRVDNQQGRKAINAYGNSKNQFQY